MRRSRFATVLLPILLLAACSDSTAPDSARDDIRGFVLDADGQPVAGAVIVLGLQLDGPLRTSPDKPQTAIRFDLPQAGSVSLWLSSFCDGDTVRQLISDDLPSGGYAAVWDGRDDEGRLLPDGVYWYHLVTSAGETRDDVLLLWNGYGSLAAGEVPAPLAVTSSAGRFTLDQGCLPFGETFTGTDEEGTPIATFAISRQVRVWAFDTADGTRAASAVVAVDRDRGVDVEIHLGR